MTTSVSAQAVDCGYTGHVVLSGVGLELGPGEVVALVGSNGAGKSTLMKTVAGAIPPLAGRVALDGDEVRSLTKREIARRIGYVPQIEAPAFDFTVREIVLMGRLPYSEGLFESPEDRRIADEAVARADCRAFAERPVSELSGGEGQRVRIARALAQQAPVLMMDEPTTHLDVRHQIDIGRLVRELANDGMAILVAVHDLNWAATFATRCVVLGRGRVLMDGPVEPTLRSGVLEEAFGVRFVRTELDGLRLLVDAES